MEIKVDELSHPLSRSQKISLHIARLDALHPVVSGNKYFKLKYNIEEAAISKNEGIITFGGAYSNHLAAAAFACKEAGLKSIGVVRGEKTSKLNHTLQYCSEQEMLIEYVSRDEYKNKERLYKKFQQKFPAYYLVPEGGDNDKGEKGCMEILRHMDDAGQYTHIICAVGTGTTFRGIVKSSLPHQKVIGIVVLKGAEEMGKTITENLHRYKNFELVHHYHFGGYAKKSNELIDFMNSFYKAFQIPSDFVYTGKLFYAVEDLISKNYFPAESKILCIHSGGLQGNLSLPEGILFF